MKCDEEPGSDACHDLMVDRIRYFTGRHMTARDFRDADAYHRSFRHLHNRVLHGSGIACGLEVERHWNPECRRDRVIVRCGLAIDCCGREIVVPRDLVTVPIPWDKRPAVPAGEAPTNDYVLLLCLKYREVHTEKVPVLYSPTACSTPAMEDGRIRECYELGWHWVRRRELGDYGWHGPQACGPPEDQTYWPGKEPPEPYGKEPPEPYQKGSPEQYGQRGDEPQRQYDPQGQYDPKRPYDPKGQYDPKDPQYPQRPPKPPADPCRDDDTKPPVCCLDPRCPHDHCVPLAIIAKPRDEVDAHDAIDTSGRRTVAPKREQLTHICWLSWEHGGLLKASELRSLKVRFDQPLRKPEFPKRPGPRGINERTFVVQYGEQLEDIQTEDLDFVEYAKPPYLTDDGRTAVYEIRKPLSYRNHVIHVTLKCDFLEDCRKNAVDGDFLNGRLSTGNGIPGGTFESWFRVVDDDDYERLKQQDEETQKADAQEWQP